MCFVFSFFHFFLIFYAHLNPNPPLETTKESNEFMKNLKSLIVSYEKYTTLLSNQKANGTWDTYANALYGNANLHDYCIHH
jgi:hypothetical protein